MTNPVVMRAASVISAQEFALALSDLPEATKIRIGIQGFDMPTLVGVVADAARGQRILAELGYRGAYYVKTYKGVEYVIIKGLPSLRNYLVGTRYLASNPQVVRIGLGPIAANSTLRANYVLAMTMYTATDIASLVVGDGMTFSKLMGNFAFNSASSVASGLASYAAGAAIANMTVLAAPAILGGIVVGVMVSVFMSTLNEEFQISQALAAWMEKVAAAFSGGDVPPDIGVKSSCVLPKKPEEIPELELCILRQRPGKTGRGDGTGDGTGNGSGGEGGQGGEGDGAGDGGRNGGTNDDEFVPPDYDPPVFDDDGHTSSSDDAERLDGDVWVPDEFAGEGGQGGFCVGWVGDDGNFTGGCTDGYGLVEVPGHGEEDGSQ